MTSRWPSVLPMLFSLTSSWSFGSVLQLSVPTSEACERRILDERVHLEIHHDAAGAPETLEFRIRERKDLKATVRLQNHLLFLNLNLRDDGRSRALSGREVYHRALDIFGDRVKGAFGVWDDGDNLDVFNWLTGRGWSAERAARETWTGRTSALFGFTEVSFDLLDGSPGHYTAVIVRFEQTGMPRPTAVAPSASRGRPRGKAIGQ